MGKAASLNRKRWFNEMRALAKPQGRRAGAPRAESVNFCESDFCLTRGLKCKFGVEVAKLSEVIRQPSSAQTH